MNMNKKFKLLFIPSVLIAFAATAFIHVEERNISYNIEFKSNLDYKDALSYIRNNVCPNFKIEQTYNELFNGVTIKTNSSYFDALSNLSFIKTIEENKKHKVIEEGNYIEEAYATSDNLNAYSMNIPESNSGGEGISIAIIDSSFMLEHECFTTLKQTTKAKYNKESIEEIKKSPAFHGKNETYFNKKVPYFFDYGGDVAGETPTPDNNVFSPLSDHGHHVASLCAGNGDHYKGIAYNAQLLLMKVFTTDSESGNMYCFDSSILSALEDCKLLGVDLINMSLGNDLDDFKQDSLCMQKIKELNESGTLISVAAGNSGKGLYNNTGLYEYWDQSLVETGIMSEYTNTDNTTVVGSCSASYYYYDNAIEVNNKYVPYIDQVVDKIISTGERIHYDVQRYLSSLQGTKEYVSIPGYGEEEDYQGKVVNGKVAVINRGETTFESKVRLAVSHGAIGVVIIDNVMTETSLTYAIDFNGYQPEVPVGLTLYAYKDYFDEVGALSIKTDTPVSVDPSSSSFSSDGATYDLNIKPDILAPGDQVLGGIYQRRIGGYRTDAYGKYSGTSMAAPNYTGALAVALSERSEDPNFRNTIKARMMTNARILKENGKTVSVRKQGAGLVDVDKTISNDIYIKGIDSKTDEEINEGKILLRNNGRLSLGVLDLSFNVYSEHQANVEYTVNVEILVNDSVVNDGTTSISTETKKIGEFTENIDILPGKNEVTLTEYTFSEELKEELKTTFPNGCVIEGFVSMTPTGILGAPISSVPFLGFFGNYNSASPVEPFDFERSNKFIYPSDYVNNYLSNRLTSYNGNFSSLIASGDTNIDSIDVESVLKNQRSFDTLPFFTPARVGYDADADLYMIHTKQTGENSVLIIQQFVTRSVKDNTLTITRLSDGKVVATDHMFDSLTNGTSLFKSMISNDLASSSTYAHRAYTILPMYNIETREIFKEGKYRIDINYELASGGTYTCSYIMNVAKSDINYRGFLIGTLIAGGAIIIVSIGAYYFINRKKAKKENDE